MISRQLWIDLVEKSWRERPVIWLTALRRVGKTTLSRSIPDITYFDCELPSSRSDAEDTEAFLKVYAGRRIVLDEIHRLSDPSIVQSFDRSLISAS